MRPGCRTPESLPVFFGCRRLCLSLSFGHMSLGSNRAAIYWVTFTGIVTMSCDSGPWPRMAPERQAEPPHLSTNAYGMVSIGRVNTIDSGERAALVEYFNSN